MRIIKEKFYEPEGFYPEEEGYIPLKEPDEKKFLKVVNLMVLVGIILSMIMWKPLVGMSFNVILFAISSLLIIIPHEFTHALFFPEKLSSDNVIIGSYLKAGVFYAAYDGEINKRQLLMSLLGPQITLTILPIFLFVAGFKFQILLYIALTNFIGGFGDFTSVYIVIKNFPKYAIGRNKGYKTYIK